MLDSAAQFSATDTVNVTHRVGQNHIYTVYIYGSGNPSNTQLAIGAMRKACFKDMSFLCKTLLRANSYVEMH